MHPSMTYTHFLAPPDSILNVIVLARVINTASSLQPTNQLAYPILDDFPLRLLSLITNHSPILRNIILFLLDSYSLWTSSEMA